jgi:DDB1- and CUL4-associated factor 8
LSRSLNGHKGCVNAIDFNKDGSKMVTGSDDCKIFLWDWAQSRQLLNFTSGHKSNVFQSKFIPGTNDSQIVTCARDGQVRLSLISSSGSLIGGKRLARHATSCHKLAIGNSSNVFMSSGEDGVVNEIDLRNNLPNKLLMMKNDKHLRIPLYSIAANPVNENEFIISGKDASTWLYDKRMLTQTEICKFTPKDMSVKSTITCSVYNHNGTEIVASYSDDNIYLFDNWLKSSETNVFNSKHSYKGHLNSETVKGVNFYGGPSSDYIVSGSDCGGIFFWEKETEQIVKIIENDNGIVNVVESHPNFPILATSGLDYDIKLWEPTAKNDDNNHLEKIQKIVDKNERYKEAYGANNFNLTGYEFELLLLLMQRPVSRLNLRHAADTSLTSNSHRDEDDEDDDDDDGDVDVENENGDDDDEDDDDEDTEPRSIRNLPPFRFIGQRNFDSLNSFFHIDFDDNEDEEEMSEEDDEPDEDEEDHHNEDDHDDDHDHDEDDYSDIYDNFNNEFPF